MSDISYVLITPARNEAEFIELTIRSVVAQTIRPLTWVIVSDGSTDGTDDIVRRYAENHDWIKLVRMPERRERHFAGKVHAFNAGYERVKDLDFDVVASLDGDISFGPEYFSFLLRKLDEDRALGVVGTAFMEGSKQAYDYRLVNIEHVSGACQVFRRECFEQVGGYVPVKGGCIDHVAVVTARMKGWKTRCFPGMQCVHHRPMGTAQANILLARFANGKKDYSIGNHPLWELSRCFYQMGRKPVVAGGLLILAGFVWSALFVRTRPVSQELVEFVRQEQMARLRRFLFGGAGRSQNASTVRPG